MASKHFGEIHGNDARADVKTRKKKEKRKKKKGKIAKYEKEETDYFVDGYRPFFTSASLVCSFFVPPNSYVSLSAWRARELTERHRQTLSRSWRDIDGKNAVETRCPSKTRDKSCKKLYIRNNLIRCNVMAASWPGLSRFVKSFPFLWTSPLSTFDANWRAGHSRSRKKSAAVEIRADTSHSGTTIARTYGRSTCDAICWSDTVDLDTMFQIQPRQEIRARRRRPIARGHRSTGRAVTSPIQQRVYHRCMYGCGPFTLPAPGVPLHRVKRDKDRWQGTIR